MTDHDSPRSNTTTLTHAEEQVARPRPQDAEGRRVWDIAATVNDPDIPVLSIEDLGVLRSAEVVNGTAVVSITPTYSGCPCIHTISDDVIAALEQAGYPAVVHTVLSPAWTSDWLSEHGRQKLLDYGIAPPTGKTTAVHTGPAKPAGSVRLTMSVKCPQCGSLSTRETSRFGATLCKALYVCENCQEPFEYFKVY